MTHDEQITGLERAPKEIADALTRFGGKHPYGGPNYRLVVAERRMQQVGGEWNDWPDHYSIADRGGLTLDEFGNASPIGNKPIRVVAEVRTIPKYPNLEGWVVEKWYPPQMYGTQTEWYSHKVPFHDVPKLGPYPYQGDYERVSKPLPEVPSLEVLQLLVQTIEYNRAQLSGTPEQRILRRLYEFEQEEEKRKRKQKEAFMLKGRDEMKTLLGTSLAAGRLRNEVAERAGITEHVGN